MKTALLPIVAAFLLGSPVGDPTEINFAELSNFDYEEGKEMPESVTKHHKKLVKVGGFMATEDGVGGDVEYFILVNDACGCEGTPKLNEMIFCAMPVGQTVKIKPGTVSVTGTIHVEEEKEEGVVVSIYTMSVDSVK